MNSSHNFEKHYQEKTFMEISTGYFLIEMSPFYNSKVKVLPQMKQQK